MADLDEIDMIDDENTEEISLESILAEYKGSAYINGDKRTPTELLNEQTERIISEALGGTAPDSLSSSIDAVIVENLEFGIRNAELLDGDEAGSQGDSEFGIQNAELETEDTRDQGQGNSEFGIRNSELLDGDEALSQGSGVGGRDDSVQNQREAQRSGFTLERTNNAAERMPEPARAERSGVSEDDVRGQETEDTRDQAELSGMKEEMDSVILFFENYRAPELEPSDNIIADVEKAIEREIEYAEEPGEPTILNFDFPEPASIDEDEPADDLEDDEIFKEPELAEVMGGFTERLGSISLRIAPAIIITLIMVILTLAAEGGLAIPFGIGRSQLFISGTLIIMLLVVMMLCVDLVIRGVGDLIRGAPNAETLILFSCVFSVISGTYTMLTGATDILPYCAVSAVSLTLAAYGERLNLRAITETLKTAVVSSEPYGVQAEYNEEINKTVLKKAYNRIDGFYSNLMHPDVAETAYRYAAPILLAAALVLSVISAVVQSRGEYFLHTLSALLAAAAPFSAMLTFSIPFGIVVRAIRKAGAAIAGWGGVDDICFTDGASVTDGDLFPPGTLAFTGMKVYEDVSPEKAIRYTASLIIASGSGLTHIFAEVLNTQKMEVVKVGEFMCYEGGIGAHINGEDVVTGSAAFMNLQGIRIPDDMNMKNAVFTAFNNKLIALFVVEYSPINSVQSALISMLKWRIKLFFAMRDFNITPLMLEQKFRVSLDDIEYIQTKDSYSISDSFSGRRGRMAALLTREGLGPYAEAITGGRLLKSAALVATAISVISAAIGVIFMFYMCWNGSFLSAKPGNLLLFMLSTLAAVIIVCGYVKCKK